MRKFEGGDFPGILVNKLRLFIQADFVLSLFLQISQSKAANRTHEKEMLRQR